MAVRRQGVYKQAAKDGGQVGMDGRAAVGRMQWGFGVYPPAAAAQIAAGGGRPPPAPQQPSQDSRGRYTPPDAAAAAGVEAGGGRP